MLPGNRELNMTIALNHYHLESFKTFWGIRIIVNISFYTLFCGTSKRFYEGLKTFSPRGCDQDSKG